jgi:hypothetical protein
MQRTIKRIVTCQGSIQLVAALSVIAYRDAQEHTSDTENHLVIYELNAPAEQLEHFVTLIQTMATSLSAWTSITYLSAAQLAALKQQLFTMAPTRLFNTLYEWIGTDRVDEIYLCRNWQFSNQLLINAYQAAQKICYGDGIGIYFPGNSAAFFATPTAATLPWAERISRTLIATSKQIFRDSLSLLQTHLRVGTVLKTIDFDQGYFVLPDAMELPPMPYQRMGNDHTLQIIKVLTGLVNLDFVTQLQAEIGDAPIAVLLTANLSESERLSPADELQAYTEFLQAAQLPTQTVLVIKPHPRDDLQKIRQLQAQLSPYFQKVLTLTEPELFYLPFEIFFLRAFLSKLSATPVQVFAVSSACLGLKLLFDVPSTIGFGEEITSKRFYKHYIDGRLAHEQELKTAIRRIAGKS